METLRIINILLFVGTAGGEQSPTLVEFKPSSKKVGQNRATQWKLEFASQVPPTCGGTPQNPERGSQHHRWNWPWSFRIDKGV